ncbi:hypothetical protein PoB_007576700 [Plakobranchus ocellatus]|uniref:Secreted protein n=1 Tax=Plakobranchus ocellatus TaxID=259542 RepID=A0AAV4DY32_9GAST|nr:hypothetical protein PoB_007576700 [Plakobranchus ocellatus]
MMVVVAVMVIVMVMMIIVVPVMMVVLAYDDGGVCADDGGVDRNSHNVGSGDHLFLNTIQVTASRLDLELAMTQDPDCDVNNCPVHNKVISGFSGPPSGQGAGSGARTRDRMVPADLRADSQATVLPTPPSLYRKSV